MEMIPKFLNMLSVNVVYALVCIFMGIFAMWVGYKIFDRVTFYNTAEELQKGNTAVAIFQGAVVLGVAICSALIIGLTCN
jgi:uncharacterized membrane protein YjfL (UPF0719 family)